MDNKNIIPYEEKPLLESDKKNEDTVRILNPVSVGKKEKWTKTLLKYWKFASVTAAFAVVFFLIFGSYTARSDLGGDETLNGDSDVAVSAAATEKIPSYKTPPVLMNESDLDIELAEYSDADYSLSHLRGADILIIHSHNSEYISSSTSVEDAGKVISDILISAGINVIHYTEDHDSSGSIGAYERMASSVQTLVQEYPDIAVVIDLHDSDSGLPITFTVGAGANFGWNENLRLACAVYSRMENTNGAVRVLPGKLGQNTGILTLNIGIGSLSAEDDSSREVIAELSRTLIDIIISEDAESSLYLLNETNLVFG